MIIKTGKSVGKRGENAAGDVKCIQALINVYLRANQQSSIPVDGKNSPALEEAIGRFQVDHTRFKSNPDCRVDPKGETFGELIDFLAGVFTSLPITRPDFGLVTWESEGAEGGFYHSRKLHVPSSASGLTLGRGYDCRRKSKSKLRVDFTAAGLPNDAVDLLCRAAALYGETAEQFIIDNDLLDYQLSPAQQMALFEISYAEQSAEVKRICNKHDVVQLYGKTDWDKLHPAIKDIAIDLKFRGDYTGFSRRFLQQSIADNDVVKFRAILSDKRRWPNVPPDRFQRRVTYLETISQAAPEDA